MITELILQLIRGLLILIFVIFFTLPITISIRNILRKKHTWYFLLAILCIYCTILTYFVANISGLSFLKSISLLMAFAVATLTFYKIDELKQRNPEQKINLSLLFSDVYRESKGPAIDLARKYIILSLILIGLFILFYFMDQK